MIILITVAILGCNESNIKKNKSVSKEVVSESRVNFSKNVFSPEKQVLCDRKSKFCSDSFGISLGFTKEFLGDKAQNIWLKRMTRDFDGTIFTMSDGIYCDTNKKICKKSKWDDKADLVITKRLFGEIK